MKKINNTLFIITIVAISTLLISIPRALSAYASAQAEAKSGKANAQSYAQAQSDSTTASTVNINSETNKTSAISQTSLETSYSNRSTQLSPSKISQNQEDTREATVGEQNNINNEQQLTELKKLIENNKNSLETISQKLEDTENRQIKILKMFIFDLIALAVIILLELVLIFRRPK